MLEEDGTVALNKFIPTSIHTKPFHIEPGMHHMENLHEEVKGGHPPKKGTRLQELQKIDENLKLKKRKQKTKKSFFGELGVTNAAGGSGATRTLQPIKGRVDIGSLLKEEEAKAQEGEGLKKKLSIAILQTHRFFSDLDGEDSFDAKQ